MKRYVCEMCKGEGKVEIADLVEGPKLLPSPGQTSLDVDEPEPISALVACPVCVSVGRPPFIEVM